MLKLATRMSLRWLAALIALIFVAIGVGALAYEKLFRRVIPIYANDEEHFKYGSIGNDGETGLPYPIWLVLPKLFPQHLPGPGGYAALGFRWEPGRTPSAAPIGFSRARVGVERIAINCAFCHVTTFRRAPDAALEFALAGVSNTVDVLGYQTFLTACARDPRFTASVLLPAIEAEIKLTWLDRVLYRYILIPFTRRGLLAQGQAFEWTSRHRRPAWGPGRIDPFNPVKFAMLGLPDDGTIGNSDMQAVWNLDQRNAVRADAPLHWDGLNNSIREVVLSSALGDGTTAREYDARTRASLDRIDLYLRRTVAAPSPHRPDPSAAMRGRQVYLRLCGNCHEAGGAQTLTVVPVAEVGTDRHRVDMWTTAARDAYNGYRRGYDWGFHHFRKVEGYVSEPLDGLWLRAPYLHNGSVPTLADLLEPPERRPSAYLRGIEVLDAARGGFVAPACEPGAVAPGAFCYDTRLPGNGNGGHVYGTDLPAAEKADLLAYLLTL